MLKAGVPRLGCPGGQGKPKQVGDEHGEGVEPINVTEHLNTTDNLAESGSQYSPGKVIGVAQIAAGLGPKIEVDHDDQNPGCTGKKAMSAALPDCHILETDDFSGKMEKDNINCFSQSTQDNAVGKEGTERAPWYRQENKTGQQEDKGGVKEIGNSQAGFTSR